MALQRVLALRVSSGSHWEALAGYARAVREGPQVLVSSTTTTHGSGRVVCPGDAPGQAVYILDKIHANIEAQGGRMEDVLRNRVYLRVASQWRGVAEVHGCVFAALRPANTMLGGAALIGDHEVEIEGAGAG